MSMRVTRWPRDSKRVGDAAAARQRDVAFGGPAAHEDGDVEGGEGHDSPPACGRGRGRGWPDEVRSADRPSPDPSRKREGEPTR